MSLGKFRFMNSIPLANALLVALTVIVSLPSTRSSLGDDNVDYARDVKPILKARCYPCHGALKQEAGLRLDSASLMLKGGDGGAAIELSDAKRSLLLVRVTASDEASRMPQEGAPLSAQEIATLTRWIEQGAKPPADDAPEPDPREHWSFKRIVRPEIPTGNVQNAIDACVAAEWTRHSLSSVDQADKSTLLRRLHLDLTGLPPTRDDLHAFLADDSPGAYEKLVDRLLASPQYGERWGRHWMDVWRYSDWYGRRSANDVTNSYPMIWRWRDWIVRSLNADKGYDQMIVEMLAGDEVAPEEDENVVATGFLVRNCFRWNYNQWMKDNIEHTAKAFLGLTLNCAHCHDHKYDPISQEEYFAFRAFFESLELRHDRVAGSPDPGPYKKYVYTEPLAPITSGMVRVFDEKLDAKTNMYLRGDERNVIEGKPPIEPRVPAVLGIKPAAIEPIKLPPAAAYPGVKPFIIEEELAKSRAALAQAEQAAGKSPASEAVLAAAKAELASLEARIEAGNAKFTNSDNVVALSRVASMAERLANHARAIAHEKACEGALAELEGKSAKEKERNAAKQKCEHTKQAVATAAEALKSESETFTLLTPTYPAQSTGRRTALARAIVDRNNPLTARVAVNHIWMRHFGRPLVESVFDFGRNGKRPSHPELLDWLAVELIEAKWSMKHLHRLIVTSATYRLASAAAADSPQLKLDADNHFFWRFPRQRMQAEVLRDSILHSASQLDLTQGGPEIEQAEAEKTRRRSLYLSHHGERRAALLESFNAANPADCYRRIETVVPQQALAIANDQLTLDASRTLARNLWQQILASVPEEKNREAAFIDAVYEQLLTRLPKPPEREASLEFIQRQIETYQAAAVADDKAASGSKNGPSADPALRARESLVHALYNHHDFISVR